MRSTGTAEGANLVAREPQRRRDAGASLVEYAFLIALIAVVCIAAVVYLGEETSSSYSEFGSHVSAS